MITITGLEWLELNLAENNSMPINDTQNKSYGLLSNIVIGASDGITIPFAVAMGFAAAGSSPLKIVSMAAIALGIGAVTIAVGAFTATRTVRHEDLVPSDETKKNSEEENVRNFLHGLDIGNEIQQQAVDDLNTERKNWQEFTEEHQPLIASNKHRRYAALTIVLSYVISGSLPLLPFLFFSNVHDALRVSIVSTCVFLFLVGWLHGAITNGTSWKQALRVLVTGAAAGAAAYAVGYFLKGL
jgi:VIT1/CCC1 family predicted Fe2+/Mn2+ transporter